MSESNAEDRLTARHGLTVMKRAVRQLGSRAIDGRTTVGKTLTQWREELVRDLGGRHAISTQQSAIIDLALKTKWMLDSIDAWLLTRPSLVDKRRRALLPVVRERQQLADALAKYMVALGLERQEPPAKSLTEYLSEREHERHAADPATFESEVGADGSNPAVDGQPHPDVDGTDVVDSLNETTT